MKRFNINLSDAFVIRWLVWIRLFDFEIRHVFDIKHIATDDFFKKSFFSNDLKKIAEKKILTTESTLNWIVCACFLFRLLKKNFFFILISEYFEKSQKIVVYLFTLRKFSEMSLKEFNKFKKKTFKFKLQRNQFFRRNSKNVLIKKMIDELEKRQRILKQLYDENNHRNKKNIYRRIMNRYWWNDLYENVQKYVKICS